MTMSTAGIAVPAAVSLSLLVRGKLVNLSVDGLRLCVGRIPERAGTFAGLPGLPAVAAAAAVAPRPAVAPGRRPPASAPAPATATATATAPTARPAGTADLLSLRYFVLYLYRVDSSNFFPVSKLTSSASFGPFVIFYSSDVCRIVSFQTHSFTDQETSYIVYWAWQVLFIRLMLDQQIFVRTNILPYLDRFFMFTPFLRRIFSAQFLFPETPRVVPCKFSLRPPNHWLLPISTGLNR